MNVDAYSDHQKWSKGYRTIQERFGTNDTSLLRTLVWKFYVLSVKVAVGFVNSHGAWRLERDPCHMVRQNQAARNERKKSIELFGTATASSHQALFPLPIHQIIHHGRMSSGSPQEAVYHSNMHQEPA